MCQSVKSVRPSSPSPARRELPRIEFSSALALMIAIGIVFCLAAPASAQKKTKAKADAKLKLSLKDSRAFQLETAIKARDYSTIIKLTEGETDPKSRLGSLRARSLQERGQLRFFAGMIDKSIEDFDEYLEFYPDRDPQHWQRGIAFYYAEEFEKGKAQFERHQKVNEQDVENAVWHFLCAARAPGGSVEKAKSNLIPIEDDARVPMQQIHALFADDGSVEDVLKVCETRGDKNYGHLYIGLYFEAMGETEKAKSHIEKCANELRMDHYMGQVGQVHAKLRGWKTPSAK